MLVAFCSSIISIMLGLLMPHKIQSVDQGAVTYCHSNLVFGMPTNTKYVHYYDKTMH